jgi:membrane-associated protein
MLFAELNSIEDMIQMLSTNHTAVYPILFLGSFFETLIPFSLMIYGEIFFIAGAVLAGAGKLNIWAVAGVLYCGAILGDNSSYWLGRRYGINLFDVLSKWPVIRHFFKESYKEKGIQFFRKRGEAAVFFARLCGPFSWFVPALAGVFQQRYCRFIIFNTLGIIIGIGEFLVLGYLFGNHLDQIVVGLQRIGILPVAILVLTAMILFVLSRRKWKGH